MKMKHALFGLILLFPAICLGMDKADFVVVKKSESRLYLMTEGRVIKKYPVSFGSNPKGHKYQKGDKRTPEGFYFLDYKKEDSAFYKSIHISYPNETDIKQAIKRGLDPGGMIMIHGQPNDHVQLSIASNKYNWTDGCIALTNKDMDEVWQAVEDGTPIRILP